MWTLVSVRSISELVRIHFNPYATNTNRRDNLKISHFCWDFRLFLQGCFRVCVARCVRIAYNLDEQSH